MKLEQLCTKTVMAAVKTGLCSAQRATTSQGLSQVKISVEELKSKLLNRRWMLRMPDTEVHRIVLSPLRGYKQRKWTVDNLSQSLCGGLMEKDSQDQIFYIVRDDLLHPLVNGNKARKLDGLIPLLMDHAVTDVVTCGGLQSAHTAAVAVSCAGRGMNPHLLLRGEQPEVLTGYNLISTLYGNVTYVPRSVYAYRESMLTSHANLVAGDTGHVVQCRDILKRSFTNQPSASNYEQMDVQSSSDNHPRKVAIVNEGAGDTVALLGVIRLMEYLSQDHLLGKERSIKLVVDAGTGTTAIGLGIGALCLGLPWEVVAVMLADTVDAYKEKETLLIHEFKTCFGFHLMDHILNEVDRGVVHWVNRHHQRKFGNVLDGEVETCQQIAKETGVLVDPVYTLAAWEMATHLSKEEMEGASRVVMLHTGGTLGMFGLAQRYKSYFHS